jgi:hypothetical protein
MNSNDQQGSARKRRTNSDGGIDWKEYPRIAPGEYRAFCYWGKRYRDPGLRRWTCLLRWNVLSVDLQRTLAYCVPLWWSLGEGVNPRASRRGKYLREWVRANDGPPSTGNRLSPRVFTQRFARVEIGDAVSPVPYSVVRRIIVWETGFPHQLVRKYTSQEEQEENGPNTEGSR